jgi:two-component sensor histidine kinase
MARLPLECAVHTADRPYAEQQWREAIAAHRSVDFEFWLYHADDGVGLHLVRVFTRQLGGTVIFHSDPGTTAELDLPQTLTGETEDQQ